MPIHIVVYPTVDAADVVSGTTDAELRDLEARLPVEYVPDESQAERIVRALVDMPLQDGSFDAWAEPYVAAGLSARWLDTLQRLRIRNLPGFCIVREIERLRPDNRWWANGATITPRPADGTHEPRTATFALGLDVTFDSGVTGSRRRPRGDRAAPPRRPYPSSAEDVRALKGLAAHLAPRVAATFNGAERLRLDPILAPVCAMNASVASVTGAASADNVKNQITWQLLDTCLDSLDLGEHRATAERVLVRDDAEHIHIEAPPHLALEGGRRSLGLFAQGEDGGLVAVDEQGERSLPPRILYCLLQPEPQ